MSSPNLVGVGSIFIDDVVLPTGETRMAQLGGGVLYALIGSVIWGEKPGLVGFVGEGIPSENLKFIQKYLDSCGLHYLDIPQARTWQLFDENGTRQEIPRVEQIEVFELGPNLQHFTLDYAKCEAVYLIQDFEGILAWTDYLQDKLILWEPLQQIMLAENRAKMRKALQSPNVNIVSPNLIEAQAIYDLTNPKDLVQAMFDDGADLVTLRMGDQGSIVARQSASERYHIPAIDIPVVVDQTGAGNIYCGAFLTGLMRGKSLIESACMATVASSFCIEDWGVPNPDVVNSTERDRRYQDLLATFKS